MTARISRGRTDRTVVCDDEELEPFWTQLPTLPTSDTPAETAKRDLRTLRLPSSNSVIITLLVALTIALWDDLMLRENGIMGDFHSVEPVTRDDLRPKVTILRSSTPWRLTRRRERRRQRRRQRRRRRKEISVFRRRRRR